MTSEKATTNTETGFIGRTVAFTSASALFLFAVICGLLAIAGYPDLISILCTILTVAFAIGIWKIIKMHNDFVEIKIGGG